MYDLTVRNGEIVQGSLGDLAKQENRSVAEIFVRAEAVVIVDTSGSMGTNDSRGGRSRYEVAVEELEDVQASIPGKVAVVAFSSDVIFCPGGVPWYMGGGTDLAKALNFTKVADVPDIRFIVISDGYPNDEQAALAAARTYQNRIDTIYVGPEFKSSGRDFLNRLSQASGGVHIDDFKVNQLGQHTKLLIEATA